ncbi:acyl-CoA thioesterase [Halobaculum magnesiiphilum]|uniref:Acyl-CoA thioesterase n=2 Tax=Halobaculum magnesiiphilum TaxID=1017351 RepID=A0A8T8WF08_9EURY|nr:acyl-CoA thioesterase [Halobaculum magnesiiphilum]
MSDADEAVDGTVDRSGDDGAREDGEGTLAASYTEMTELLLPNDTNNLGRALGGAVLHWMDICGAIAAMRFSRRQCVTASMDHVDFIAPIDLGEVAVLEAYVFNTGRTSVDVKVDVRAENPRTGEERRTTTSFLTFVALDEEGSPTPVPDLDCPTPEETALREEATEERRTQLADVSERLG